MTTSRVLIEQFVTLLARWNERINLTGAASAVEIEEHVADSEQVVPLLGDAKRVLDVGSGGGFPAAILAIELPTTEIVALEPVHKKHAFLRTVARELRLPNLHAIASRLEDHDGRDYDVAMSRATFELGEWLMRGSEYVRIGGRVLGFEAQRRDDLPAEVVRHEYVIGMKPRAIVSLTRR